MKNKHFAYGTIAAFLGFCVMLPPAGVAARDKTAVEQTGSGADVAALISDALNLMRSNKNAEAADELKRAIAIKPNSAEAHHNYGLALAKLGDSKDAIEELKQARSLNPGLEASWLTLGGLQQASGDMKGAVQTYGEYLQKFNNPSSENYKRISALKESLEKELPLQMDQSAREFMLQTPAAAAGTEDYLAEATRKGILRWPNTKMPIKVFIHPVDTSRDIGYRPAFRDILVRSFRDWSKASNGEVKFQILDNLDDAGDAQIHCFFAGDATKDLGGLTADAEAGEAQMSCDQHGLAKGTIKIVTKSLSPVLPLTDNRMRVICLHEIGHALGLAGHTTNPDDIMFYSTSFKDEWRELSGRDARTIQRLYASN